MPSTLSHEQIQNFLHNVTKGRPDETKKLLMTTPEITQELLRSAETFTDDAGRTFNCTAYEYAHWAKDVEMCLMLERHMDNETCSQISSRIAVNDEKGLNYGQNGKEYHSTHFDFNPFMKELKKLDNRKYFQNKCQIQYTHAQYYVKYAQKELNDSQLDLEDVKCDPTTTQRDVTYAKQRVKRAKERAEPAPRAIERAKRGLEKAKKMVENAHRDIGVARNNIPAYALADYSLREFRNLDNKNTKRLDELRDALYREDRLILQNIPEYSALYGQINNLKQKAMSLPSDIRGAIYRELGFLMRNINNPGMDKCDLIRKFEENCCSKLGNYLMPEERKRADTPFFNPIFSTIGAFIGFALGVALAIAFTLTFLMGPVPVFCFLMIPVITLGSSFLCGMVAGGLGWLCDVISNLEVFTLRGSIKKAIHDIAKSVSSNPVIQLSGHEKSMDVEPDMSANKTIGTPEEEYHSAAPLGFFGNKIPLIEKDAADTYSLGCP